MTPYYQDDHVTIYHGNNEDVPFSVEASAIVTDPPYGVNLNTKYKDAKRGTLAGANNYLPVHGDDAPFDPSRWIEYPEAILWGAQYYASLLPNSGKWLLWDKRVTMKSNDQADAEMAWTWGLKGTVPRVFRHVWNGMIKASERREKRKHPTQKPVALMKWCLEFVTKDIIVDPYMGSGPTLIAAKAMGKKAIGVEIEEGYCEIAAERLSQGELDLGETV